MSTKKNAKKAVKAETKKAEVKKAEVKKVEPKWGTPEWAYAHPWTEMDRKRKARVTALGVFSTATKDFLERFDAVMSLSNLPIPGDMVRVCDATRQLALAARHDLAAATYNLAYVVDALVVADLLAAWTKEAE